MVGPIKHHTLRSGIMQSLREAIQQRRLAPGARLSDSELAAQLGVSHSTVREALHQLTHEGLVVSAPNRGFFVAGFTLDDLIDLLEMRGLLEGRIAELVASELRLSEIAALAAAAEAIGHVDPGASSTFWEADQAFHELLVRSCTRRILVEMWSSLSRRLTMLELHLNDAFESTLSESHNNHVAYVTALATRDPARAHCAAEEHYRFPIERLRRLKAQAKEDMSEI